MGIALEGDVRTTTGVLRLSFIAVEWGGLVVLRMTRGNAPATELQRAFARAGHAHAAVLLLLAIVGLILVDATGSPARPA